MPRLHPRPLLRRAAGALFLAMAAASVCRCGGAAGGAVAPGPAPPPVLRATWINVWVNSNQSYVPGPGGNAANGVRCSWADAMARYNVSFPAGDGTNMTLENPHAVDWVGGGPDFGNAYAYLALLRRAGIDVLIPDFTNGFSNANSRFPVDILHGLVAAYFPEMRIAYAVSATSFAPAHAYIFPNGSASYSSSRPSHAISPSPAAPTSSPSSSSSSFRSSAHSSDGGNGGGGGGGGVGRGGGGSGSGGGDSTDGGVEAGGPPDTRNYLLRNGRPVFVVYATYADTAAIRAAHPECEVLFADGESPYGNKAGWHTAPYSGYGSGSSSGGGSGGSVGAAAAAGNSDVFWVAPSLDWQTGTASRTWVVSLPWLAYGMHAYLRRRADPKQQDPWLLVVGSFDDASERNMWMPAVTSNTTTTEDVVYRALDGSVDAGSSDPTDGRWTVFYDIVSAFLNNGTAPAGRLASLVSRAPLSVGAYRAGTALAAAKAAPGGGGIAASATSPRGVSHNGGGDGHNDDDNNNGGESDDGGDWPAWPAGDDAAFPVTLTGYANPPAPFNRGVSSAIAASTSGKGDDDTPVGALVRTLHPLFPPDLLFPVVEPSSSGSNGHGGGAAGDAAGGREAAAGPPLLQEFVLLSGSDDKTTRPVVPLHFAACQQCGHNVCAANRSVLLQLQLPWTANPAAASTSWAAALASGPGLSGGVRGGRSGAADDTAATATVVGVLETATGDLVLPAGAVATAPAQGLLGDCDVLGGRGVSFLTADAAGDVLAVPRTYPAQSVVLASPVAQQQQRRQQRAGHGGVSSGGGGTGRWQWRSTLGGGGAAAAAGTGASDRGRRTGDSADGAGEQFVLYAPTTGGKAFFADAERGRVGLAVPPDPSTSDDFQQFVWTAAAHPASPALGLQLTTTLRNGTRVAWSVGAAASPAAAVACGADGGADCLHGVVLRAIEQPGQPPVLALDTAFDFL